MGVVTVVRKFVIEEYIFRVTYPGVRGGEYDIDILDMDESPVMIDEVNIEEDNVDGQVVFLLHEYGTKVEVNKLLACFDGLLNHGPNMPKITICEPRKGCEGCETGLLNMFRRRIY